jgi:hypothetical protein
MPTDIDPGMAENAFLDDPGRLELIAANQYRDMVGEFGKKQTFFGRAVAAADYGNSLAFVKGSVARGTKMYAGAKILVFSGDIQSLISAAGGNKHCTGAVCLSVGGFYEGVIVTAPQF